MLAINSTTECELPPRHRSFLAPVSISMLIGVFVALPMQALIMLFLLLVMTMLGGDVVALMNQVLDSQLSATFDSGVATSAFILLLYVRSRAITTRWLSALTAFVATVGLAITTALLCAPHFQQWATMVLPSDVQEALSSSTRPISPEVANRIEAATSALNPKVTDSENMVAVACFKILCLQQPTENLVLGARAVNVPLHLAARFSSGKSREEIELATALKNGLLDKSCSHDRAETVLDNLSAAGVNMETKGVALFSGDEAPDSNFIGDAREAYNIHIGRELPEEFAKLSPEAAALAAQVTDGDSAIFNFQRFKGGWENKFKKSETLVSPFNCAGGSKVDVPMMNLTREDFNYTKTEEYQAIKLSYTDKVHFALIVLPNKEESLNDFVSALSAARLSQIAASTSTHAGHLALPKFKTSFTGDLIEPLKKLGVHAIWDKSRSTFQVSRTPSHIDRLVQSAGLEVNEEGTIAYVLEGQLNRLNGVPDESKNFDMIVDRPFLFCVCSNQGPAARIHFIAAIRDASK